MDNNFLDSRSFFDVNLSEHKSLDHTCFRPQIFDKKYYDIEEKDKDKDEDEENEMNFNMSASTYARTQTSSPIGKPEQQRSCPENRPERFQPRDWKDNSSDSEDSCLLYLYLLYISYFTELSLVVLYMFY